MKQLPVGHPNASRNAIPLAHSNTSLAPPPSNLQSTTIHRFKLVPPRPVRCKNVRLVHRAKYAAYIGYTSTAHIKTLPGHEACPECTKSKMFHTNNYLKRSARNQNVCLTRIEILCGEQKSIESKNKTHQAKIQIRCYHKHLKCMLNTVFLVTSYAFVKNTIKSNSTETHTKSN